MAGPGSLETAIFPPLTVQNSRFATGCQPIFMEDSLAVRSTKQLKKISAASIISILLECYV